MNIFPKFSKKRSKLQEDKPEIKNAVKAMREYADESKKAADAVIEGIDKDTGLYMEKIKKHSEENDKRLDKMSQKLKVSLEENDEASIDAQLDEMMSMLDEDIDSKIRQEIADEKLKSANVKEFSENGHSADNAKRFIR